MTTNRVVLVRLFAVCMIALAGLSPVARAATYTWDADAGTIGPQDGAGTWNTTLQNWWDGTQNIAWPDPNTADIAQFGAGSGAAGTVTVNAVQANGLTFAAAGSGNYTLSSGTITLGGSSPTITTNANATIQSVLAGSGFTKNGSSTLTFSGASANTYSGTTTINAGNLALSKNANVVAIPGDLVVNAGNVSYTTVRQFASTSSVFVNNAATLNSAFNNSAQTVANVTYNSSSLTDSYLSQWTVTGTLAVGSGRISFATNTGGSFGAIQMTGGELLTYANGGASTINIGSGGLSMTNAQIRYGVPAYNGAGTVTYVLGGNFTGSGTSRLWKGNTNQIPRLDLGNATRTFTITDGTTTIDTGVSVIGTGGLTKAGAGTLTLSGSNSYSGGTILSAGTLKLGSGGSFANSPLIVVGDAGSSGAVLDLTEKSTFAIDASQTLMGKGTVLLGENTAVTINGLLSPGNSPGLLTWSGSGSVALSGTTLMEVWGTSRGTDPGYDAIDLLNGTDLIFGGILNLDFNQTFANSTSFNLFTPDGTSTLAGNFSAITMVGPAYTDLTFTNNAGFWTTNTGTANTSMTFNSATGTLSIIVVPEPAAISLAGIGAGLAGYLVWKRRRTAGRR